MFAAPKPRRMRVRRLKQLVLAPKPKRTRCAAIPGGRESPFGRESPSLRHRRVRERAAIWAVAWCADAAYASAPPEAGGRGSVPICESLAVVVVHLVPHVPAHVRLAEEIANRSPSVAVYAPQKRASFTCAGSYVFHVRRSRSGRRVCAVLGAVEPCLRGHSLAVAWCAAAACASAPPSGRLSRAAAYASAGRLFCSCRFPRAEAAAYASAGPLFGGLPLFLAPKLQRTRVRDRSLAVCRFSSRRFAPPFLAVATCTARWRLPFFLAPRPQRTRVRRRSGRECAAEAGASAPPSGRSPQHTRVRRRGERECAAIWAVATAYASAPPRRARVRRPLGGRCTSGCRVSSRRSRWCLRRHLDQRPLVCSPPFDGGAPSMGSVL